MRRKGMTNQKSRRRHGIWQDSIWGILRQRTWIRRLVVVGGFPWSGEDRAQRKKILDGKRMRRKWGMSWGGRILRRMAQPNLLRWRDCLRNQLNDLRRVIPDH